MLSMASTSEEPDKLTKPVNNVQTTLFGSPKPIPTSNKNIDQVLPIASTSQEPDKLTEPINNVQTTLLSLPTNQTLSTNQNSTEEATNLSTSPSASEPTTSISTTTKPIITKATRRRRPPYRGHLRRPNKIISNRTTQKPPITSTPATDVTPNISNPTTSDFRPRNLEDSSKISTETPVSVDVGPNQISQTDDINGTNPDQNTIGPSKETETTTDFKRPLKTSSSTPSGAVPTENLINQNSRISSPASMDTTTEEALKQTTVPFTSTMKLSNEVLDNNSTEILTLIPTESSNRTKDSREDAKNEFEITSTDKPAITTLGFSTPSDLVSLENNTIGNELIKPSLTSTPSTNRFSTRHTPLSRRPPRTRKPEITTMQPTTDVTAQNTRSDPIGSTIPTDKITRRISLPQRRPTQPPSTQDTTQMQIPISTDIQTSLDRRPLRPPNQNKPVTSTDSMQPDYNTLTDTQTTSNRRSTNQGTMQITSSIEMSTSTNPSDQTEVTPSRRRPFKPRTTTAYPSEITTVDRMTTRVENSVQFKPTTGASTTYSNEVYEPSSEGPGGIEITTHVLRVKSNEKPSPRYRTSTLNTERSTMMKYPERPTTSKPRRRGTTRRVFRPTLIPRITQSTTAAGSTTIDSTFLEDVEFKPILNFTDELFPDEPTTTSKMINSMRTTTSSFLDSFDRPATILQPPTKVTLRQSLEPTSDFNPKPTLETAASGTDLPMILLCHPCVLQPPMLPIRTGKMIPRFSVSTPKSKVTTVALKNCTEEVVSRKPFKPREPRYRKVSKSRDLQAISNNHFYRHRVTTVPTVRTSQSIRKSVSINVGRR